MQIAMFNAKCPFEIGDKVYVAGSRMVKMNMSHDNIKTITDIACTHYLKSGTVEFTYELDNSEQYHKFLIGKSVERG